MSQQGYCIQCGKSVAGKQAFCPHCGTPIDQQVKISAPHMVAPSNVAVAPTVALGGGVPAAAPNISGSANSKAAGSSGKRPRRAFSVAGLKPYLLIGGVVGAVLLILGSGYWFWTRFSQERSAGIAKMLVLADDGNDQQAMYLVGLSSNDLVELAGEMPPDDGGFKHGWLSQVDRPPQRSSLAQSWAGENGVFLSAQQRIVYLVPIDDSTVEVHAADLAGQNDVTLSGDAAQVIGQVSDQGGKALLLERGEQSKSTLVLTDLNGTKTVLVDGTATIDGLLSPDGKHVVYWEAQTPNDYSVTLVDSAGANPIELATGVQGVNVHWSHDSTTLFVSLTEGDRNRNLVMDANGGDQQELHRRGRISSADVAQGFVIYSTHDDNSKQSLYISRRDGSDKRDLVRGSDGLEWNLTPDRRSVVVRSTRSDRSTLEIFPVKGGDTVELVPGANQIAWLYDDDRVVVATGQNNQYSVLSMNLHGQDEQEIIDDLDSVEDLAVHHGQVAISGKKSGQAVLHLWNGRKLETLADDADQYLDIAFTPDGRSIVYTDVYGSGLDGMTVYKIDTNGKKREQIMEPATVVRMGWY